MMAITEQPGAGDAIDMAREAHAERARESSEAGSAHAPSDEAVMSDGPMTVAPVDGSLGHHADPMGVNIAVPALAVAQQHGAEDAQAMIQEAFDEFAREQADMLAARRLHL